MAFAFALLFHLFALLLDIVVGVDVAPHIFTLGFKARYFRRHCITLKLFVILISPFNVGRVAINQVIDTQDFIDETLDLFHAIAVYSA